MRPLRYLFITLFSLLIFGCGSESIKAEEKRYEITHRSLSFYDHAHSQTISAELFSPLHVTDETFDLILFAHGYQQLFSDYHDIYERLVPLGYHVALLTTHQGISIDIDSYAQDIVTLHDYLHSADSPIVTSLSEKTALMGHSTGGGAIYIANQKIAADTLISLAPLAECYGPIYGTDPLSVLEDQNSSTLILSGEYDCVTPSSEHQQPLFDAFEGEQKAMVTIHGGDHCGFSDSLNCPIGESALCGFLFQEPTIGASQQMALTLDLIIPWLSYTLQEDQEALENFKMQSKAHDLTLESNF